MSLFLFYNECFMFFVYFCESRVNNNLTYMVKMKRLFLLCAFVSMFATCNFISAQKELGIFNSVSVLRHRNGGVARVSEIDGYRVILSLKIKIGLPGDLVQYAVDGSVLEL